MPGPGPHMMYAMGTGLALGAVSEGRFSSHHTLTYSINAFFGPDIGSFSEWLGSFFSSPFSSIGSALADYIHHPFFYILILSIPFSALYASLSNFFIHRRLLYSPTGVPLSRRQCLFLVSAGSLSHFFLDHLFEENGHSSMYTWVLSTGWWKSRAPVNTDAVLVVGFLCTCLIGGFIYLNRVRSTKNQAHQSLKLLLIITSLYCLWCASQIYWVNPRRPAVGEEADLGVIVFLATYFFLPHSLCILSINPKDHDTEQLPR